MQTSRTGTIINGMVVLIFDDASEYTSVVGALSSFASSITNADHCTAIDTEFIVQKMKANYTASDPLYKGSPTTSLSDSLMQCLISITLAAIRKCDATEG